MKNKRKNFFLKLILFAAIAFLFYSIFVAWGDFFQTEIIMEGNSKILDPEEKISIRFSFPVSEEYFSERINIYPETGTVIRWEEGGRKMVIFPEKNWKPGEKYEISIPGGKSKWHFSFPAKKFFFSIKDHPRIESVFPQNLSRDVVLDIEDPIIINFKNSTKDFFIKFNLDPLEEIQVENNPEKTQFRLMPKKGVSFETKYVLDIFSKYSKEDDSGYKKIYSGSFVTALPPKIYWEKDLAMRIDQAKKYIYPRINFGKYIDINLSAQVMTIFENGKRLDSHLISSGKTGMDTPKGEAKIYNKAPRPYSRQYGLYMPYWMALAADGKFGIHELPEWPGGYKEGANHLGMPVSHGCVRLGVGPAEKVYSWADIGTPVVIY